MNNLKYRVLEWKKDHFSVQVQLTRTYTRRETYGFLGLRSRLVHDVEDRWVTITDRDKPRNQVAGGYEPRLFRSLEEAKHYIRARMAEDADADNYPKYYFVD